MTVSWDPRKAEANLKKHGVRFSDAEMVLWDPQGITIEDAGAKANRDWSQSALIQSVEYWWLYSRFKTMRSG